MNDDCELQGCRSRGTKKRAIGTFQVFDGDVPTMTRPAKLCAGCVVFAGKCGMKAVQQGTETTTIAVIR